MTFVEQVVHVFKKDLWRFWPALIGLGALMVAHVTTGIPTPGSLSGFRLPVQAGVFQVLLAAFAVAVIQEDGVANDRAFWATRPLSGHALLTAKAAFIALFLVLAPVALHVNWLQRLGGGGPTWGLMADSLLYHGGLIAMVALGAATTNTMRSFLVVALSAWIVLLALGAAFASDVVDWSGGRRTTDDYLMHWSWLVVGGGLLIYQYVARRTLRTFVLAAMAFAVTVPLIQTSDADWSVDPHAPTERFDYQQADDIQLSLRYLTREQNHRGVGRDAIQAQVRLVEQVGVLLIPTEITSHLSGGGVDRTFDLEPRVDPFMASPALVTGALPGMQPAGGGDGALGASSGFAVMVVEAGPEELDGPLRRANRMEITLSLDIFRPRVIGTSPLEVGAWASVSPGRFQVESVRRVQRGITLEYSYRAASRALVPTRGFFGARDIVVPLLYNRTRGEYLDPRGGSGTGDVARPLVGGAELLTRDRRTAFNTGFVRNPAEVPDEWFNDVELVIVGREYVGSLTRTIVRDIEEWPDYGPPVEVDAGRGR